MDLKRLKNISIIEHLGFVVFWAHVNLRSTQAEFRKKDIQSGKDELLAKEPYFFAVVYVF